MGNHFSVQKYFFQHIKQVSYRARTDYELVDGGLMQGVSCIMHEHEQKRKEINEGRFTEEHNTKVPSKFYRMI